MTKKPIWLGAQWLVLIATAILFGCVAFFVDLRPVVDENFFFSTRDPEFRQQEKIDKTFPSKPEVVLAVAAREIASSKYVSRIERLTRRVREIDGVSTVKSVTAGPKSYQDALASPFWNRLLIAEDRKCTNVIIFMEEGKDPQKPITQLERVVHEFDGPD